MARACITLVAVLCVCAGASKLRRIPPWLHNAVAAGQLATVEAWLDAGGDPELRESSHNFTMLHIAGERRQLEMIDLLLRRGADMDARTIREDEVQGGGVLEMAAMHGHEDVVTRLIERGANVNRHTFNGYTPLMGASLTGQLRIVEVLLRAGASTEARDDNKMTAQMHAEYRNHDEVALALRRHAPVASEHVLMDAGTRGGHAALSRDAQLAAEPEEPATLWLLVTAVGSALAAAAVAGNAIGKSSLWKISRLERSLEDLWNLSDGGRRPQRKGGAPPKRTKQHVGKAKLVAAHGGAPKAAAHGGAPKAKAKEPVKVADAKEKQATHFPAKPAAAIAAPVDGPKLSNEDRAVIANALQHRSHSAPSASQLDGILSLAAAHANAPTTVRLGWTEASATAQRKVAVWHTRQQRKLLWAESPTEEQLCRFLEENTEVEVFSENGQRGWLRPEARPVVAGGGGLKKPCPLVEQGGSSAAATNLAGPPPDPQPVAEATPAAAAAVNDDDEAMLCAVCLEEPRTNIMVPCGHVCLCARCAQQNWAECPMCRAPTTMVMRAYY